MTSTSDSGIIIENDKELKSLRKKDYLEFLIQLNKKLKLRLGVYDQNNKGINGENDEGVKSPSSNKKC